MSDMALRDKVLSKVGCGADDTTGAVEMTDTDFLLELLDRALKNG